MSRRHTEDRKQQVVAAWRSTNQDQRSFSEANGISDRTLRNWISSVSKHPPSADAVRQVIRKTIHQMERFLEDLDEAALSRANPAPNTELLIAGSAQVASAGVGGDGAGRKVAAEVATPAPPNSSISEHAPSRKKGALIFDW